MATDFERRDKINDRVMAITFGLVGVSAVVALAVLTLRTAKKTVLAPEKAHTVLPNCGGVAIQDPAKAKVYAEHFADLGLPREAECNYSQQPSSLVAIYQLVRWYLGGAVKASKIAASKALEFLVTLKTVFLIGSPSLSPTNLPEGLG